MKRIVLTIGSLAILLAGYAYFFHRDNLQELVGRHAPLLRPQPGALYKWQDKTGEWHYTDSPPPTGVRHEMVELRSDVNVMPAAKEPQR